jgi:hypothetical protein
LPEDGKKDPVSETVPCSKYQIMDKVQKPMNTNCNVIRTFRTDVLSNTWVNSVGILTVHGDVYIFNSLIAISNSKALGSGTNG